METPAIIVSPPTRYDSEGKIIPFTPEEQAQHSAAIRQGLSLIAEIPDDPNEDDAEFFRALDSHRPHAPMFRGMY